MGFPLHLLRKSVWSRWILNLTLCFGAIVVALLLFEGFLRWFAPVQFLKPMHPVYDLVKLYHRPSAVPGLPYELVPNKRGVATHVPMEFNRYGMRGNEPIQDATAPLRRVAVIGDSFCFGAGLPVEQVFPMTLERYLNTMKPEDDPYLYEVLNFGVIGYSIQDEVQVLKYKALQWNPDLIVWAYVMNDPQVMPIQPIQRYFVEPNWWEYSHLIRLLVLTWGQWEYKRLGCTTFYEYLHHPRGSPWKHVEKGLRRIRELVEPEGIPVLMMVFPDIPTESWEEYPYDWIHEQMDRESELHGFDTLDLLRVYRQFPPQSLRFAEDDSHPSRFGHQVTAATLFLHLSERWWNGESASLDIGQLLTMPSEEEVDQNQPESAADHE